MRRLAIAIVLALAIPSQAALAATGSSPETLASVVTITMTGVPATLDYGTVSPAYSNTRWNGGGNGVSGGSTGTFAITFGADSGAAATLTAAGTDLTGASTISKTNRKICKATFTGGGDPQSLATCGIAASSMATTQTVSNQTTAGTNAVVNINLGWALSNPPAGSYTGSVTFTAQ